MLRKHPLQTQRHGCRYCCSSFCKYVKLASFSTYYYTAIPVFDFKQNNQITYFDSFFARLNSSLNFGRVRFIDCWQCAAVVCFVDSTSHVVKLSNPITTLSVSSLLAQLALNVTITMTLTKVNSTVCAVFSDIIAPSSLAAALFVVPLV